MVKIEDYEITIKKILSLINERLKTEKNPEKLFLLKDKYQSALDEFKDTGKIHTQLNGTVRLYLDSYSDYSDNPLIQEMDYLEQQLSSETRSKFYSSEKCNESIQKEILNGVKVPHRTSYPVIYKENDRYRLAVFVFFFTADDIRVGLVDRPTMWAIADIETGEIIERQHTKEKDFSDASYDIKYDIRSDNEYNISKEYYEKAFSILDSVREKIITEGVFDKTEYAKYMDMVLANIPEKYKRFYVDLSTDYKKRTTALVIIDVQKGFLSEDTKHIPKKIKELLSENQFDFIIATRFKNREESPFMKYLDWYEFLDENDWSLDEFFKDETKAEVIESKSVKPRKRGVVPDGVYYLRKKIKRWNNQFVEGTMRVENGKFIVQKGSICCPIIQNAEDSALFGTTAKRAEVETVENVLQEDVEFNSVSMAAQFLTYATENGWDVWKTEDGQPIDIYRK